MPWTIQSVEFSRPEYWSVGSLSLLQGIFPTQGSSPGLPYCRWILYQLSHKGSPLNAYKQSIYCFTWGKHQAYRFIIHEVIKLSRFVSSENQNKLCVICVGHMLMLCDSSQIAICGFPILPALFLVAYGTSQLALVAKNPPAMQEQQKTWVRSLGQEDPLEEGMATHSSILPWRVPWTEEPGRLESIAFQRVRRN